MCKKLTKINNYLGKKLINTRVRGKFVFGFYFEIKLSYEKDLCDRWTFDRVFFPLKFRFCENKLCVAPFRP